MHIFVHKAICLQVILALEVVRNLSHKLLLNLLKTLWSIRAVVDTFSSYIEDRLLVQLEYSCYILFQGLNKFKVCNICVGQYFFTIFTNFKSNMFFFQFKGLLF